MTGSANAFPLPLRPDEVTAEWLSAALRTRCPDARVESLEVLTTIQGTATKLRARLRATGVDGLPEIVWIKGGFADHRELLGEIYQAEARFFTEFAPNYDLRIPTCYVGVVQQAPAQGIVLLEDLDEAVFNVAIRPISVEEAASGLETLASLHGQSWGDRAIGGAELMLSERSFRVFDSWFADLWSYFTAPRAFAGPVALHDPRRLRAAFDAYRDRAHRAALCLVHGDAHIGNSYRAGGSIGLVDWQTAARGCWFHDVNYFLVSALDIPLRRAHEEELLRHYLDALGSYPTASPPSFEDAWNQYRCATIYGLLAWLCNPNMWQPEEINTATYARFAAAASDFDTYALLGA